MIQKLVVYLDADTVIALKFDRVKREITVGGFSRLITEMEMLVSHYFKCNVPRRQLTQRNKVRYVFRERNQKTFATGIESLRAENISVVTVKSHGRMMR